MSEHNHDNEDFDIELDEDGNVIIAGLPNEEEERREYASRQMQQQFPDIPSDKAEKYAKNIAENKAIRKLDDEENTIYGGALVRISNMMPAFRDALAHLRPYVDVTAQTAYVDRYSRVALSPWWFHGITNSERAGVLLHESMHVMNNHFDRQENSGFHNQQNANITMDMEINTTIQRASIVDLPDVVVYPERDPYLFEKGQTFEQYYALLQEKQNEEEKQQRQQKQDQQGDGEDDENGEGGGSEDGEGQGGGNSEQPGQGGGGSGSGSSSEQQGQPDGGGGQGQETPRNQQQNGGSCDTTNEAREAAADEAGVNRASKSEQTVMKSATSARIQEELSRSRAAGSGHMDEFYRMAYSRIYRPVSNWKQILRRLSSRTMDQIASGNQDYSFRKVNRRKAANSKFIFPGTVMYKPSVMLGVDISGSMQESDQMKTVGEAEALLKELDRGSKFRVFPVDTEVGKIKTVDSVKKMSFEGGGGTAMEVAFDYVIQLPKAKRPDFFVLATDGGTDWNALMNSAIRAKRLGVFSAILVTHSSGWEGYMSIREGMRIPKGIHVIDCTKEINS